MTLEQMKARNEAFWNLEANKTCKNIPVMNFYDPDYTMMVEMDIKFVSPEDNVFISVLDVDGKKFYQDWIWNYEDNRFEPLSDSEDSSNKPKDIWKFNNFVAECPRYLSLNKLYDESIMDAFFWHFDNRE